MATRPKEADLIVVLGNAVDSKNRPLPSLASRLEAALALYRRGGQGVIMVSGGIVPNDGRNEAQGMRDWLVARGVSSEAIVVDEYGDNTRASAEHAHQWLAANRLSRVVVVSQYFHLPRARLAMRQAGATDAGGDYPRRWFIRDIYSSLREVAGYVAYAMRIG